MSEINTLRFKLLCDKFSKAKAVLDDVREERDEEFFNLKKVLFEGESTGNEFLDLCVCEFGPDFKDQYARLNNLMTILEKNKGQYAQINTIHRELSGGARYNQSIIGMLDDAPLFVRKSDEEWRRKTNLPIYSLQFNFKGKHIFYEDQRTRYSKMGPRFYDKQSNLVKGPADLSALEFKNMEFSSDSRLDAENTIYVGNDLLPEMVSFLGIEQIEGIPSINELYVNYMI